MVRADVREQILQRVAELGGEWPSDGDLARDIGCHKDTVKDARRFAESRRIATLTRPCDYCGRLDKVDDSELAACEECSEFLLNCQALARITRCLMTNRPVTRMDNLQVRRAKLALAAIVDEWVVRKSLVDVCGDAQNDPDTRHANAWFYDAVPDDEDVCARCHVRAVDWQAIEAFEAAYQRLCKRCVRFEEEGRYTPMKRTLEGEPSAGVKAE